MNNGLLMNYTDSKRFKIALAVISGVFTFLFLLFFQPFGVNNYRPDEKITVVLALVISLFAFVTITTLLLAEFVVYYWLFPKKKPKTYVVWVIFELWITASMTFMLYNFLGEFHDFYFLSYLKHLFEVGSILILPFAGIHFYFKHLQIKRRYEDALSIVRDDSEMILIKGDYKSDQIALLQKNIICIKSEDNYASIHYLENQKVQRYLIRLTLNKLEKKLTSDAIIRINRSVIINKEHLESFKMYSGVLELKLGNIPKSFKVSKSRQSKLLQAVKKHTENFDSSLE